MATANAVVVDCPNCRNRFQIQVEQIIDVGKNPALKSRFLAGQVNAAPCSQCGFPVTVSVPLAYHDPGKELLMIYVPLELNMHRDEQEILVGRLTRTIADSLPLEKRKGYLLNPRRTLTMQGMLDTVLEADGITKEMLNARRDKMALVETLLKAEPEKLPEMVAQEDEKLDEEFFKMVSAAAEVAMNNGNPALAERMLMMRDSLLEHSSYGKQVLATMQRQEEILVRVSRDLNAMGKKITHDKLLDLLVKNADDDEYLQAFVGLVRPALDYTFFEKLTERVEEPRNKRQERKLAGLRDRLLELTQQVDRHRQALVQQATMVLQEIINSDNIEQAITERLPLMSDMFIGVLEANIEAARERQDNATLERLETVYQTLTAMLQRASPPEIQFINELIQTQDEIELRLLLADKAPQFGVPLLEYMDALMQDLRERGAEPLAQRLSEIRLETARVLKVE